MDEIRLEVPKEAFEIHHKRREFAPAEWFASALPMHLIHTFRHRTVFDLTCIPFELNKNTSCPPSEMALRKR
jgi:hypothetical protein